MSEFPASFKKTRRKSRHKTFAHAKLSASTVAHSIKRKNVSAVVCYYYVSLSLYCMYEWRTPPLSCVARVSAIVVVYRDGGVVCVQKRIFSL